MPSKYIWPTASERHDCASRMYITERHVAVAQTWTQEATTIRKDGQNNVILNRIWMSDLSDAQTAPLEQHGAIFYSLFYACFMFDEVVPIDLNYIGFGCNLVHTTHLSFCAAVSRYWANFHIGVRRISQMSCLRADQTQQVDFITVSDDLSECCYLSSIARVFRFQAWAALVCSDGVDGGQNDGVIFLHYASVLGAFLMRLRRW